MKDKKLISLCDKLQFLDYLMVNKPKEYLREFGSKKAAKKEWLKHYPGWLKKKRNIIIEVAENCKPEELEILEIGVWEIYKKRDLAEKSSAMGIRTVEV